MADKLNQIEINGKLYDLQDKDAKAPFTGTREEVEQAIADGTILDGDIVNITDDVSEIEQIAEGILDSKEEISANTLPNRIAGANAVKEIINDVNEIDSKFSGCYISFTDADGNPTDTPYLHWDEEVAD